MLEFHETYSFVDVWMELDKATGKNHYVFWYGGKTYQRDTQKETRDLIKFLTKGKQRG